MIIPHLPPEARKTYQVVSPIETHTRPASCAEADCGAYIHGWKTTVDESTELGQGQAHYIRKESGRAFTEQVEPGLTVFTFDAGQRCFAAGEHRVPLDRPEFYIVREGDHDGKRWRNPRGTDPYRHANGADWVDDFANHQQRIADRIAEG